MMEDWEEVSPEVRADAAYFRSMFWYETDKWEELGEPKFCDNCNKEYYRETRVMSSWQIPHMRRYYRNTNRRLTRHCSDACRKALMRDRQREKNIPRCFCGKGLLGRHPNAKYCSPEHKRLANKWDRKRK